MLKELKDLKVFRVILDIKVDKVLKVVPAVEDRQEFKVHKAVSVRKDQEDLKVDRDQIQQALGDLKEPMELLEPEAIKVLKEGPELQDDKVDKELQEFKVRRDRKDLKDFKEFKVTKAYRVIKVFRAHRDHKAVVVDLLQLAIAYYHIIIGMLVKVVVLHSLVKMATVIQEYLIQILGVMQIVLYGTYRIKTRRVMLTADGIVILCPSIKHTNIDLLHG